MKDSAFNDLCTIAFLRQHGLAELIERYRISARRHREFANLVLLKYRQIDSPMHERIVQECRGLIVDESADWAVVCRAYDKFFNYGEPQAAAIDWPTARVEEKLDGSLMTLYHYAGQWRVASSGLPDAAGHAHGGALTFAELFWQTWKALGYAMPQGSNDRCYMFELMTPMNRIIVSHDRARLVLHGVRDRISGQEFDPTPIAAQHGWESVRQFPLGSIEDCVAAAAALNPLRGEGFVVRDAQCRRVKIKCPQYVALTHLKTAMNGRRLLEIIRANESDELLTYFPEFREPYEKVRRHYDDLCAELESAYVQIKDIADQRAFAAEAAKTRHSSPLFAMRKGSCKTVKEFFAGCTIQTVERALGVDLAALVVTAEAEEG